MEEKNNNTTTINNNIIKEEEEEEEEEIKVLPEADSLPDGFVDSSSSSPCPCPPVSSSAPSIILLDDDPPPPFISPRDKDDYKDELLVHLDSRPPTALIFTNHSLLQPHSHLATEGFVEGQVAIPKEISPTESDKKEPSEVKRKNTKRIFKSEKEFLEFTLKYQQVITERDAAITMRDKLESLCRELQKQNKKLMDECKRVSMEGQNLRLDISSKFRDAIQEVSNKLEEQKGECLSQLKENEMLRSNLKQFADQYTLSEQQHANKLKEKTLELQLADLKIQHYEEKLLQEQSQMKVYAEQVSKLLTTEKNLRLQLTADGAKFQQFQDALVKSNEVFESFKKEIEKMTKSVTELKKENTFLKSKCDKSDFTLIQLVDEREHLKKQLEKTRNQKEKLESLCRSLQEERKQSLPINDVTTQKSVAN